MVRVLTHLAQMGVLMALTACTQTGVERGIHENLAYRNCAQIDNASSHPCTPRSYESYLQERARILGQPSSRDE